MNVKDVYAFLVHRHVDEKHLIEAAFADHFRWQQVDAVGGCRHEQASNLFLHPSQEKGKDAALLTGRFRRGDAHFDFIKPNDCRGNGLHRAAGAGKRPFRVAMTA